MYVCYQVIVWKQSINDILPQLKEKRPIFDYDRYDRYIK